MQLSWFSLKVVKVIQLWTRFSPVCHTLLFNILNSDKNLVNSSTNFYNIMSSPVTVENVATTKFGFTCSLG